MSTPATVSPPAAGDALVPPGSWRVSEESVIGFTVRSLAHTVNGRCGSFSGRLVHDGGDGGDIPGTLTIKGVSKDVSLIGRRLPPEPGEGSETIRIAAEAMINRHA